MFIRGLTHEVQMANGIVPCPTLSLLLRDNCTTCSFGQSNPIAFGPIISKDSTENRFQNNGNSNALCQRKGSRKIHFVITK